MPILNTRVLLRLIVVVALLGGGLFGLHTVQARRVPDAVLWQANTAAEQGKADKAIGFMRQYLELRPDDHDTALRLADLIVERATTPKETASALFLYEKVLREAPERHDVGRKLVAVCLRLRRYGDALAHADRLLAKTPDDSLLLMQVGECHEAQDRPDDARTAYADAVRHDPANVPAAERLASLLVARFDQETEARKVLDRTCDANPLSADAFLARGRLLKQEGDFERVLSLNPDHAEALVSLAEIKQSRGDVLGAEAALSRLLAAHPKHSHGYRALAWLQSATGRPGSATATLTRGVAELPEAAELWTPLAELWIDAGETERVEEVIRKFESRPKDIARSRFLRGRWLMRQKKWDDALAVLDALRVEATALPGLAPRLNLLVAECHGRLGDRALQSQAIERAVALEPTAAAPRVARGNYLADTGRPAAALAEFRIASRLPDAGPDVWTGLVICTADFWVDAVRR